MVKVLKDFGLTCVMMFLLMLLCIMVASQIWNEKTLAGLEKKHGIRVRWQENDTTFQNAQQRLSAKKKSNELLRLHKMASERTFLLELKTKYAGRYTDINNQLDVIEGVFH